MKKETKEKIIELIKSVHHYSLSCRNAEEEDDPNIKLYLEQVNYVADQILELFSQERQKLLITPNQLQHIQDAVSILIEIVKEFKRNRKFA